MRKTVKNKTFQFLSVICLAGLMTACNDKWDEHYNDTEVVKGDNLYVTLQQQPNLSKFVRLLEISGLKESFSGTEAFTVWAPENEALTDIGTENLSKEDTLLICKIVYNHLARSNHSTSEIEYDADRIYAYNGKRIPFNREGTNYFFGEKELNLRNIICSNGVIHSLKERVPVQNNLWELMQFTDDLSDIRSLLSVYDTIYFDREHSRKIGYNDKGETIYDSVLVRRNKFLDKIGPLYDEDSTFTAVFPNNAAYAKIFSAYRPYFKSLGNALHTNSDTMALTKLRTDSALFNNLIFRGSYETFSRDSVVTTTGHVFHNPAEIFNAPWQKMSNGWAVITGQLNMPVKDIYYKSIVREPELLGLGTAGIDFMGIDTRSLIGYPQKGTKIKGISGGFFKMVYSDGQSKLCVYFGKQILSAKYDLYCVLVPPIAEDSLSTEKGTILDFSIIYDRRTLSGFVPGSMSDPRAQPLRNYRTDPARLDTVLVQKGMTVPQVDCNPGLVITVNVPANQLNNYSRIVRIDQVYLKPSED